MWRTFPTIHGAGHPLSANSPSESSGAIEDRPTVRTDARPDTDSVATPDFVGMTPQDARRTARFAELSVHVEERPAESGLRGRVFRQDPAPGSRVRSAGEVTLYVGARPLVVVPDVSGVDEQDSLAILRAAGLTPSRRVERRSGSVAAGHVLRTRPRAGAEVAVGTRIAYVVAVAPRPKRAQGRRDAGRSRGRRMPDEALLSMPFGE